MSLGDWLSPALAFIGGGVGAALAFVSARMATRQTEEAGRREEWGRRFAAALMLLADERPRQRKIGRALLAQLLESKLATDDDRAAADGILALDAQPTLAQLGAVPSRTRLEVARFVQDNDDDEGPEGTS